MTDSSDKTWDPTAETAEPAQPGLAGQFWSFLWQNWAWWVTPTVLILGGLGYLIYMSKDNTVAPFIYALF